jgi:3-oxoadipate enol-lactonase
MPQLSVPGAVLNYEIWGVDENPTGPWLTLVNGHTRPLNDFRLMGKTMVAAGLRVLALDNRGAGKTEISDEFTLADMVGDVVALWRELKIKKTGLLGISMGGFIAQRLAAEHPETVTKLVLVSTAPGPAFIRHDGKAWTSDVAQVEAKLRPYFTADFAARNKVLVQSMAKQIAKAVTEESFAQRSDMQRRAIAGFDMTTRLGQIRAPTLVIHGDEDEIVGVAAGEALAAAIKGARLEKLPGAGHLLLAEKPRELYALVADWCRS